MDGSVFLLVHSPITRSPVFTSFFHPKILGGDSGGSTFVGLIVALMVSACLLQVNEELIKAKEELAASQSGFTEQLDRLKDENKQVASDSQDSPGWSDSESV